MGSLAWIAAVCAILLGQSATTFAQPAVDLKIKRSICRNTVMVEALRAWGRMEAGLPYTVPQAYLGAMEEPIMHWAITVAVPAAVDSESAMVASLLKCEANLAEALQHFSLNKTPLPFERLK